MPQPASPPTPLTPSRLPPSHLAALIFALFITIAWLISFAVPDRFFPLIPFWLGRDLRIALIADHTSLSFIIFKHLHHDDLTPDQWNFLHLNTNTLTAHQFLGFQSIHGYHVSRGAGTIKSAARLDQFGIPLALAIPALLYFPLKHLKHSSTLRHRSKHNLCPACAYDLRASTDRCPECGTPVASRNLPSPRVFPTS